MSDALEVLVGPEAKGPSASTVARLKQQRAEEYEDWSRRPLDKQPWVYVWADGIRAEDAKLCAMTVIGVDDTETRSLNNTNKP
jgi:putative transposase